MFFTAPDDARWNAKRQAVVLEVEIGEARAVRKKPAVHAVRKSQRRVSFAKSQWHMPFAKPAARAVHKRVIGMPFQKQAGSRCGSKKSQGHMPFAKLPVSLGLSWTHARRLPPGITGGSSRGEIRRWLSASKLGGLALCRRPMPLNTLESP